MKSKESIKTILLRNLKVFGFLAVLFVLVYLVSHLATRGGNVLVNIDFDMINIIMAIYSMLMLIIYSLYMKQKYSLILGLFIFAGSLIEYKNNLFLLNGKIDSNFLIFYLILIALAIVVITAIMNNKMLGRVNVDVAIIMSVLVIISYFTATRYSIITPYQLEGPLVIYLEFLALLAVPALAVWYFNNANTQKNIFNFGIYSGTLFYFTAMVMYSIFMRNLDYRFLLIAEIFETLTFSIYLLTTPLTLLEIVKNKDVIIEKSDVLKNNLFMFFKSAEYNENITVFVNSKHEILYSNSKYKIFFNNYGRELENDLSAYLDEKYEIIKYNLNYSSSIKVVVAHNTYILDIDVVFIEQNDEEIFCVTAKDITVIRAMQESLERSEFKYRSFFNLIPDYIFLFDIKRGRVIEANDMVYDDFQVHLDDVNSDYCTDSSFMGFKFSELKIIGEKINAGESLHMENIILKNVKGKDVYLEVNFRLIIYDNHKKQMLVFLRNITSSIKLHELQIENEANIRKLYIAQENEKMFNEFFANMSHELRTPINVILSALDMIELNEYNPEKTMKYAGLIKHNSFRLTRIVSNILDITKVDSGFYNLDMKNDDVVSFTEDIVMSIVNYAENKGISVVFDTEVEEHILAFDKESLERVILNLLSNAIKFTHAGGRIFVNLSVDEKREMILIDVEDNGIGISKNNLDEIFDRFIQVNKSTTRDNEGTGIGLSIVKKLMNLMGGDCIVRSELNVGTTFTVLLKDVVVDESPEILPTKELRSNTLKRVEIEFSDL
ncbi:MAG: HAMP domain-containing sensor histidine kinase [Clostridiaceae bacterium]